jgi:DNA-binding transcriptional LysR family regulator
MTLRQLEVFVAVARHGNVTRAAADVFLSQSAASMALAEMEKQLGGNLFDRKGKRLLVNERGRALLPRAREVLSRVREIEELFGTQEGRLAGDLKIGASSTIGNYLIPRIFGNFVLAHPELRLSLDVGNTEQVIQDVKHFHVDLGFIEGFCHDQEIETIPWKQDQLVVFASPHHPLAQRKEVTVADLAEVNWILRERGSGTREVFETAIAGQLEDLHLFLELGHTEAIKEAVEAGLGISCLSRLAIARALDLGVLIQLPAPFLNLERRFSILIHKEKYRTDLLQAFLSFCQNGPTQRDRH